MIIYESFLEKKSLVRKLLGGAKPPEPPHSLRHCLMRNTFTFIHLNFGAVINRRKSVFPTSLLKKRLGKNKLFTSESTQWGKDHEQVAIAKYESENKIKVSRCGFIINTKWPWLGCSPDGIVTSKAIEIKCPYSKKDMTIEEMCTEKTFYLKMVNGKPKLKERHAYFYQCQGVMALTLLKEIDFIVYTEKAFFVQTIPFLESEWKNILF